jgi:hypothetical protein
MAIITPRYIRKMSCSKCVDGPAIIGGPDSRVIRHGDIGSVPDARSIPDDRIVLASELRIPPSHSISPLSGLLSRKPRPLVLRPLSRVEEKWIGELSRLSGLSIDRSMARSMLERLHSHYRLSDHLFAKLAATKSLPFAAPPPASTCGSSTEERFLTGKIDFSVPNGFSPSDPDYEALYAMWYPYTSEATRATWKDFDDLQAMLDTSLWEAGYDPGDYPNWKYGWGRNHRFVLHLLQLVWTYRSLIPHQWPTDEVVPMLCSTSTSWDWPRVCGDVKSAIAGYFSDSDFLALTAGGDDCADISVGTFTETIDALTCQRTYSIPYIGARGASGGGTTRLCAGFVQAQAKAADHFLYWGNRCYWTSMDGYCDDLVEAFLYLYYSCLCGRLALGAVMRPAKTLVHEFGHRAGHGPHCDYYCCQEGIASTWYARTRAFLGLPAVDYESVDTNFTSTSSEVTSTCSTDTGTSFRIEIGFTDLGNYGDSTKYEIESIDFPCGCRPEPAT